jgi:hypothetical protein
LERVKLNWPLKGSYGLRSHLEWTSLKLVWICATNLLLEWMELILIYKASDWRNTGKIVFGEGCPDFEAG